MTRANIIELVKAKIDELSPFTDVSLNTSIDLVDKIIDDSAKTIMLAAPLYLLTPIELSTPTAARLNGVVKIDLPVDFLRLHSVKLTEWKIEVTDTIKTDNPLYKLQKYAPLRGGAQKPVVVIKSTPTHPVIECYSYIDVETIDYIYYIKELDPTETDATSFPDNISDIISWQCAADVIGIMNGNPEKALLKVQEKLTIQK